MHDLSSIQTDPDTAVGPKEVGGKPPARPGIAEPRVVIPIVARPKAARLRDAHLARGRHLARQERWDALAKLILTADRRRLVGPDGALVAEMLAMGAQEDVLQAASEAVARKDPLAARHPVGALEDALGAARADRALALVLALAHLEAANLWCGPDGLPPVHLDRHRTYAWHLAAAAEVIAPFDALEQDSPLLAKMRCRLLAADLRPKDRVIEDYEDLIDLAPHTPDHLRAFGRDLLPRRFGSYEKLDTEARRIAQSTRDVWGQGGYVWVYFDAVAADPTAFRHLDATLFLDGMRDILARRPDQHTANVLAAFCGFTVDNRAERRRQRRRVIEAFDWIARDHLREIHPLVWNDAPVAGRSEPAPAGLHERLARGTRRATTCLERVYEAELNAGDMVEVTASGPVTRRP